MSRAKPRQRVQKSCQGGVGLYCVSGHLGTVWAQHSAERQLITANTEVSSNKTPSINFIDIYHHHRYPSHHVFLFPYLSG